MKKFIYIPILAFLISGVSKLGANNWPEEYLGLPGDNLNLYAVMDLFQNSETLEGFERSLNDPEKMINNLDLNGDNYVDYIMVTDYVDGEDHTIVLSVALNAKETQDVAVVTVEKLANGGVRIQLIGDEALYGKDYIIEPIYGETPNPGYRGTVKAIKTNVVYTTYYEVAAWPIVTYIYMPGYRIWRSAWYWGHYPVYWSPWAPFYWHYYYGYHYNWYAHYYAYYRPWSYYRYAGYHNFYWAHRRHYSPTIIVRINNGSYRNTYSRPESLNEGLAEYNRVEAVRNSRGSSVAGGIRRDANTVGHNDIRNEAASLSRPSTPAPVAERKPAVSKPSSNTPKPAATATKPSASSSPVFGTTTGTTAKPQTARSPKPQTPSPSRPAAGSVSKPTTTGAVNRGSISPQRPTAGVSKTDISSRANSTTSRR